MPYIDQEKREEMDCGEVPAVPGELAYIIYGQCLDYLTHWGITFTSMNDVIGVLDNVKDEVKRRYLYPYEDKKIEENGDIV